MENNKIAMFFDIDGTIRSHNGIPLSTKNILKELSLRDDIDLYISTGRSVGSINVIDEIRPYFKGLVLANGGHIIIDNKMAFYDTYTTGEVIYIVNKLKELKISFGVITYEHDYWVFYNDEYRKKFQELENPRYEELNENDKRWYQETIQFWLIATNEELKKLEPYFNNSTLYYWRTFGADMVPNGRSKGTGINFILNHEGYDYNNTYAFGDSHNDLPMFKVVKNKVAMGNATDDLKEEATIIADNFDNDGLAKILKKITKKARV